MDWKQQTVVLSLCEPDYQGSAADVKEVIFAQSFLKEIGNPQNDPTTIGKDNQKAIELATNAIFHKRLKYIFIKNHFIFDKVEDKAIQLLYTPTNKIGANIRPNSLPQPKVERHSNTLFGQIQITHYNTRDSLRGAFKPEQENLDIGTKIIISKLLSIYIYIYIYIFIYTFI